MQKQKLSKIFFLGLVIILVISMIFLLKGERKDRTKNMYEKICKAKQYTFTMEESNSLEHKFIISKQEESRCLDLTSETEHITTLVRDGYAYFIMHEQEEYYVYGNEELDEIEANILEDDLKYIQNSNYLTGKEKIYGKTYYYEEYENMDSFLMLNIYIDEDTNVKTRFYFEGDNIAYIKTIVDEDNEELLKIDLQYLANKELFEIPGNYAEL